MLSVEEGVIYTRVSSQRQVSEGNGLESQLRSCQNFAENNGIKIIQTFEDKGVSGDKSERPGLQALLEFLSKRKNFTAVIIDDVSRLMRNQERYYPVKMAIKKQGGILLSVKNDLNNEDPMNSFLEHMMVGIADLERKTNNKRVRDRMEQRLRGGHWVFMAPLGYVFKNRTLSIDEVNGPLLVKIFEDFAAGKYRTYREVKESCEAKLLRNPNNGKPYKLNDSAFKKMISNKLYIGKLEFKAWGINETEAVHEALIDERTFYEMQRQLELKGRKKHPKIALGEFPLKGKVICKSCGNNLTANFSSGRSKKYPYYRCNSSNTECKENIKNIGRDKLHQQFLSLLDKARVKKEVLILMDKILEDTYKFKKDQHLSIQNQSELKIGNLLKEKKLQISKIETLNNLGIISELEKRITAIDSEIKVLKDIQTSDDELNGFKLSGKTIFENPKKFWLEGDTNRKNLLFEFVFDDSLRIENGIIGTAPYSMPYRLLSDPIRKKEKMVEPVGIEPTTSSVQGMRSPS